MAVVLLIDGENFKGKIKEVFKNAGRERPVWHEYDFAGLLARVLAGTMLDQQRFYFGKLKVHPESREKSETLIQEQRLLKAHLEQQGFEVILAGQVRAQGEGKHKVFKEKGVDVRIAVDMITVACDGASEEVVLGSSDSDLQPAIHEVTTRGVRCTYLGFEVNPNKGLSYTTRRTILIRDAEVSEFAQIQLPLPISDTPDAEAA